MAENQPQTQPTGGGASSGGTGLAPNVASLLCYVCTWVTGIIFLVIEKENKEVKFHAWQAIFLGVAFIAVAIALNILIAILGAIAGFLGTIFGIVALLVYLALLAVWIIAMIKAYQGEHWVMPVIGELAEKQVNKAA